MVAISSVEKKEEDWWSGPLGFLGAIGGLIGGIALAPVVAPALVAAGATATAAGVGAAGVTGVLATAGKTFGQAGGSAIAEAQGATGVYKKGEATGSEKLSAGLGAVGDIATGLTTSIMGQPDVAQAAPLTAPTNILEQPIGFDSPTFGPLTGGAPFAGGVLTPEEKYRLAIQQGLFT